VLFNKVACSLPGLALVNDPARSRCSTQAPQEGSGLKRRRHRRRMQRAPSVVRLPCHEIHSVAQNAAMTPSPNASGTHRSGTSYYSNASAGGPQSGTRLEHATQPDATTTDSKPVDHPSQETVDVRQGTGPRATVTVLIVSLLAAAVVGALLLIFFYLGSTPL